jgi:plasmid stabilization system protein ParE
MKLIYTPEATEALKCIYEFLLLKSSRAAAVIHNEILDEIDRLLSFPEMVPVELSLENRSGLIYRSLVVRRIYKVIYRIEEQRIYIVYIWDCRQNPARLRKSILKKGK